MPESFGELLRKEREARGLSQSELAEKAGLQPSAISHFELGRRTPSFDNLKRVADALSVTVDYLLGRQPQHANAGPAVEQLFRHFEQLSTSDQEVISSFAELLAARNRSRHEGS